MPKQIVPVMTCKQCGKEFVPAYPAAVKLRAYCSYSCNLLYRWSDERAMERFFAKVAKMPNGCWEWKGCRNIGGYGKFRCFNRDWAAHRFSYEKLVGLIPDGLTIDHLCRNRGCVNPDHLEPVTMRENTLRGVSPTALNAKKTHCKRGHELSPENTFVNKRNQRSCRTCSRANERAHYPEKAARRRVKRAGRRRDLS